MSPQGQSSPRRALDRRAGRLLLGVALLAGLFAATTPSSVEAWTPGPASGHYTPDHIQQLKNSCVWASGQMLLDKWTHGRVRISQAALRRASRDTGDSAASLFDLARGVARSTGIRLSFSPGFGDSMTWWQLLDRLEHGGGAVLIGMYSRLPSSFSRWNPAFAHSRASRHAVYVERYDRTNARVWLMDPLAPRDFPGEWIGVEALRRFASFQGDLVTAAATPVRSRPTTAPLRDQAYQLTGPSVGSPAIAGSSVAVRVGLSISDGFPLPAPHRLMARWDPIIPPPAAVAPLPLEPDDASDVAPAIPPPVATTTSSQAAKPRPTGFATSLPIPAVAGLYRLTIALVKPGDRSAARTLAPVEVQVLPSFAAMYSFPNSLQLTAGEPFTLNAGIRNIGTTDWRPAKSPSGRRPGDVRTPASEGAQTMLVLTCRSRLGDVFRAAEVSTELAPGASIRLQIAMAAPTAPGTWMLEGDVLSRDLGSMAAEGLDGPGLVVTVRPGPGADQPPRG